MESIINFFNKNFSPELVTVIVATLPVSELRGSIPLAIGEFGFSFQKAYALSVMGNLIPVLPILLFLEYLSEKLIKRYNFAQRFFGWLFQRTTRRSKIIETYGVAGLVLFVSIPLPMTGAWTGCVAAFLFGIRKRWALLGITCGVLIAGLVVGSVSEGVIKII